MNTQDKNKREKQIDALVREVRHLRSQINKSAAPVNAKVEGNILGKKGVMGGVGIIMDIHDSGPKSMPQLLEDRAYTRQHLHDLVTRLEAEGMVEYLDNPKHKRSKLIAATDKGVTHMLERRKIVMDTVIPLSAELTEAEIDSAMKVLRNLRRAFKALKDEV